MDTKEKRMRRNPVETSNFLSLLCFGWTVPIFWKGARRDLKITDLYGPVRSDESERLGDLLEREWKKELARSEKESNVKNIGEKPRSRKPNLFRTITRMFWAPYMLQGILLLFQAAVLRVMQPVLQGFVISYFNPGEKTMKKNQALLYAGFLILVTFGIIFITHHTNLRTRQIGMRVRVACCSMIYRKILRLNQSAVNNTAAGQVANLISNDVARFDEVPKYLHYLWIMPIQVSLTGYVMWKSVGVATFVGMGAMVMLTVPLQGYMSSLAGKLRSKIAAKTDERVQLMSELISGIQVVKMYAWEKPFELLVCRVRKLEMKFIGYTSYLRAVGTSMIMFTEQLSEYFTLLAFILMGNTLTAEVVFVLQGLFVALNLTCTIGFPQAIILGGEAAVSLERITDFLLLDEVNCSENVQSTSKIHLQDMTKLKSVQLAEHPVAIDLVQVSGNWDPNKVPSTLSEISIKVTSQSLCALIGPVGSGKSSLLHLVMGELPVESGTMSFSTNDTNETRMTSRGIRISYASQNPWLFAASVRDNILFGQPYDEDRYKEVTRVCALHKDFEELPDGDSSFVGERGASLSGGQKARVNLARAVYRDADLYLFDDPLSAVDPRVGRHLFDECITKFLKNKTRILVTHHLQYLRQTDYVVALSRGTVERQGTYDDLFRTNSIIPDSTALEEPDEVYLPEKYDEEIRGIKTGTKTEHHTYHSSETMVTKSDSEDISEEEMSSGSMSSKVYWEYFKAGGNFGFLAFLTLVFIAGQVGSSGTDYWVSFWANQEILRTSILTNKSALNDMNSHNDNTRGGYEGMYLTDSIWSDEHRLLQQNFGIYGYTFCIFTGIFLIVLRTMLFTRMCMNASRNIHNSMFSNLLKSTMRFFNTNPSGRILNRFSKDVGTMDEVLPNVLMETLQILGFLIGVLSLVIIANSWMIIPVVVICGLFHASRTFYLKTAQNVKRLEGITKSPMFSHANSTLDGLTTIRSRGAEAEELLRKEFDCQQDQHTGAWHISISISAAFAFLLDSISCCFITCVCFTSIFMNAGNTLGGYVGLAVSQSLMLCGVVQYGVRQSTELISQMTSVERILQYTNLPKEGPFTTDNPPPSTWPSQGGLIMKNVTMRYAENKPPVLKNLNVHISPGWKVGIVGRTGAGKSSLVSALFRLTGEGLEGEIVLDGIDTGSLGLHELRPCISIIPQEPILFSTTLRENLDPFNEYDDLHLWDALREVELGHAVPSLDFPVAGGGSNFSVGQRQLICLARAILRNNRVLVLDEATANIDHETDALIQTTIRRRFADCTVLTIAHRLNTIMDSDRVLVMKEGSIVEFDHPHLLLKNREGHFYQMLQQTGNAIAENLAVIAENAYLLATDSTTKSKE